MTKTLQRFARRALGFPEVASHSAPVTLVIDDSLVRTEEGQRRFEQAVESEVRQALERHSAALERRITTIVARARQEGA